MKFGEKLIIGLAFVVLLSLFVTAGSRFYGNTEFNTLNTTGINNTGNIYMANNNYIGIPGAERIIFDTSGDIKIKDAYLGIGSDNPIVPLQIVAPGNSSFPLAVRNEDDTSSRFGVGLDASSDGYMEIYNASGAVGVHFDGDADDSYIRDGKFGIGTISPSASLDVKGPGGIEIDCASGTVIKLKGLTGNRYIYSYNATDDAKWYFNMRSDSGQPTTLYNYELGGSTFTSYANGDLYIARLATANTDTVCWDGSGGSLLTDCSSTRELKKDIENSPLGLSTILQLTPRVFKWKSNNVSDIGMIADEVEQVSPALVTYRKGEVKSVKYRQALTTTLVKAVQEQQDMIDELRQELCSMGKIKFCLNPYSEKTNTIQNGNLSDRQQFRRLEEWTESSIKEKTEEIELFENNELINKTKKTYYLPEDIKNNPDLFNIINSENIKSKLAKIEIQ